MIIFFTILFSLLLSVLPNNSDAQNFIDYQKGALGENLKEKITPRYYRGFVTITSCYERVNSLSCTLKCILKRRRTLSVTGRPDMVHNCTTSNTSTNSFSVRCTEGFNGGLPQSFLLEVRESNSQELRANLTSPVPRFSVTHLESGALYQACIYAYNDKGRSEAMVVQAGTLRLPEKQLTSESGENIPLFFSGKRPAIMLFLRWYYSLAKNWITWQNIWREICAYKCIMIERYVPIHVALYIKVNWYSFNISKIPVILCNVNNFKVFDIFWTSTSICLKVARKYWLKNLHIVMYIWFSHLFACKIFFIVKSHTTLHFWKKTIRNKVHISGK